MDAHPKVAIITFNCARELVNPELFAANLVKTTQWREPDIIFLALQEVAPIAYSFLGGSFLNPYLARFGQAIRNAVKAWESQQSSNSSEESSSASASRDTASGDQKDPTYVPIEVRNVGMTAFILFVRNEFVQRIQWVETAGTGLGHLEAGNKGCVGVRIGYAASSKKTVPLTFLAAHLAPGEQSRALRNADWRRIVEDIVFVRRPTAVAKRKTTAISEPGSERDGETEPLLGDGDESRPSNAGIYGSRSIVFFAGDLNYRTSDIPPTPLDSVAFPQPKSLSDFQIFNDLFSKDQLTEEHRANHIFHGFQELPIFFPPTYKYANTSRLAAALSREGIYSESNKLSVWSSWRWPSWCDRILVLNEAAWASPNRGIKELSQYTALPLLPSSDHQPVTLYCELDLDSIVDAQETEQPSSITAPFETKADWQSRRAAARRLELAYGLMAYFGWTWEGNALVLATLIGAWGGWALIQSMLDG